MSSLITRSLFAALAMLVLSLPTHAQFTIQLGVSDVQVKRSLIRGGYSELKIVKRSLAKVHVEACKDGVRHYLRLDTRARIIEDSTIGTCRRAVTIAQAAGILKSQGYRRIDITNKARGYVAIACLKGQRHRVAVSKFGDIAKQRDLGSCRPELSPSDIKAELRQQGFNRIKFTDDQLPRYVARACKGERRVELVLSRHGKIRDRLKIGKCDPPINPSQLPAILAKLGFDRVEVIDEKLPRYRAEGCRGADRVEVIFNRYGKVVDEVKIDRCPPPISRGDLANALLKQGYQRVSVEPAASGSYDVNVCRDGQRIMASFSRYGQVLDQHDKGSCVSPTLDAIADVLKNRGLSKANFFVEGCREGRRVRITLNEFGDVVDRQRIGQC